MRGSTIIALAIIVLTASSAGRIAPASGDIAKEIVSGTTCVTNGFLSADVRNPTDVTDIGIYSFAKGSCPISESTANPNMILYPIGTSFNSIRVVDTSRDYTQGGAGSSSLTVVDLDTQSPTLIGSTGTMVSIGWTTANEDLGIRQDIEVQGTSATDSRIRMTMSVTNHDTILHTVSLRYLLDLFIGDYDGTWIRLYSGTSPGAITGIETDFTSPFSFSAYAMSGCNADPCLASNFGTGTFTMFGSISSPTGSTVPDRFVYGWWGGMIGTAYDYTSISRQVGNTVISSGGSLDSALLYYFGPRTLNPGASMSATIFVSNVAESVVGPELSLTPASATNPPGTTHTVTATLIDRLSGNPIPGITVSFTVTGANTASGSASTDLNGQASFTYTGTNLGTDNIDASAVLEGRTVNAPTVHKLWTAVGVPEFGLEVYLLISLTVMAVMPARKLFATRKLVK